MTSQTSLEMEQKTNKLEVCRTTQEFLYHAHTLPTNGVIDIRRLLCVFTTLVTMFLSGEINGL